MQRLQKVLITNNGLARRRAPKMFSMAQLQQHTNSHTSSNNSLSCQRYKIGEKIKKQSYSSTSDATIQHYVKHKQNESNLKSIKIPMLQKNKTHNAYTNKSQQIVSRNAEKHRQGLLKIEIQDCEFFNCQKRRNIKNSFSSLYIKSKPLKTQTRDEELFQSIDCQTQSLSKKKQQAQSDQKQHCYNQSNKKIRQYRKINPNKKRSITERSCLIIGQQQFEKLQCLGQLKQSVVYGKQKPQPQNIIYKSRQLKLRKCKKSSSSTIIRSRKQSSQLNGEIFQTLIPAKSEHSQKTLKKSMRLLKNKAEVTKKPKIQMHNRQKQQHKQYKLQHKKSSQILLQVYPQNYISLREDYIEYKNTRQTSGIKNRKNKTHLTNQRRFLTQFSPSKPTQSQASQVLSKPNKNNPKQQQLNNNNMLLCNQQVISDGKQKLKTDNPLTNINYEQQKNSKTVTNNHTQSQPDLKLQIHQIIPQPKYSGLLDCSSIMEINQSSFLSDAGRNILSSCEYHGSSKQSQNIDIQNIVKNNIPIKLSKKTKYTDSACNKQNMINNGCSSSKNVDYYCNNNSRYFADNIKPVDLNIYRSIPVTSINNYQTNRSQKNIARKNIICKVRKAFPKGFFDTMASNQHN